MRTVLIVTTLLVRRLLICFSIGNEIDFPHVLFSFKMMSYSPTVLSSLVQVGQETTDLFCVQHAAENFAHQSGSHVSQSAFSQQLQGKSNTQELLSH